MEKLLLSIKTGDFDYKKQVIAFTVSPSNTLTFPFLAQYL